MTVGRSQAQLPLLSPQGERISTTGAHHNTGEAARRQCKERNRVKRGVNASCRNDPNPYSAIAFGTQALAVSTGHSHPPLMRAQAGAPAGADVATGGFNRPSGMAVEGWGVETSTPRAPLRAMTMAKAMELERGE